MASASKVVKVVAAFLLTFRPLAAQCPDGSPPPCGRSAHPVGTHIRDAALAIALADSAVALDPSSAFTWWSRGSSRLFAVDVRGARADAELANRLQPGNVLMESLLAVVLARAGDSMQARALISHWPGGATEHGAIAAALMAVGDTAAALDQLERAAAGSPGTWFQLHGPAFDGLHGNPRYERLLAVLRPPGAVGP